MRKKSYLNYIKERFHSIYLWLVGIFLIVHFVLGLSPAMADVLYTQGIYPWLRSVYDFTLGFSPIPFVYVLFLVLLFLIYHLIKGIYKRKENWKKSLSFLGSSILKFVVVFIFLFYFLWGFNYYQTDFRDRLQLKKTAVDRVYLLNEFDMVSFELDSLRDRIINDGTSFTDEFIPGNLEELLRDDLESLLSEWGYNIGPRVRVRKIRPKGILLRWSSAGVYIPHALEGHIDGGLHCIQWPSTMAHEMSHGYGLTDEGVCNFVAYLTCNRSENIAIQYSGKLMYFRYLLGALRRGDKNEYPELYERIPRNIRLDLADTRRELDKYPDLFPYARDVIYDQYLKSHGIKDGLISYSTVVQMVADWKRQE